MKTGVIGDTHGFNAIDEIVLKNPEIERWIFLGDYVDHWTRTNDEIKENLLKIIQYKKDNPETILLIGNHDLQYIFSYKECGCSGYRPEVYFDLHDIFHNNLNLFKPLHQEGNILFSHAGIHKGWWKYEANTQLFDLGMDNCDKYSIEEQIMELWRHQSSSLFDVGYLRGGFKTVGGIFWADSRMTSKKPLENYHQIVGHTKQSDIKTYDINENTSITYCDILETNITFYKYE